MSENPTEEEQKAIKVYDLPYFNDIITRQSWSRYVPVCPSFGGCCRRAPKKDEESNVAEVKYAGQEDVVVVNNGENRW